MELGAGYGQKSLFHFAATFRHNNWFVRTKFHPSSLGTLERWPKWLKMAYNN
ncbi:hypothetical protein [Paenibacillus sp. P32E]|uniref:hypothetical protein n=1 Tax=Paenibacillus sp. P32E TaxID=1349434 RepID=UPI0015BB206D|nr:hypothetical protein [Paenibacillus sp. P32E]